MKTVQLPPPKTPTFSIEFARIKTIRWFSIITLVTSSLLTGLNRAAAGTDLPYIGPETISCRISTAGIDPQKDAGYLTNEDCQIIYVKPPVNGQLWLSPPAETWDMGFCEPINLVLESLTEKIKKAKTSTTNEDLLRVTNEISMLKRSLDRLDQSQKPALYISSQFNLDWASMINGYRQANPTKDVRPLPIRLGLLSVAAFENENDDGLHEITTGQLPYLKINALQVPEASVESKQIIPEWISKVSQNSFVMGQSASATLGLSLKQACPVYRPTPSSTDPSPGIGKAEAYLGATYTYFYPVQSKAFFRVELNKTAILAAINEVIAKKQSSDLTVPDLYQVTKDTNAFSITFNPGLTQQVRTSMAAYEKELKAMAINAFLMAATNNLKRAVQLNTTTELHSTWIRECRDFIFWQDCSVHTYTIEVAKINWEQVAKSMESLALMKSSFDNANYENLLMFDSTTFRRQ